jgi:hypothetical protein
MTLNLVKPLNSDRDLTEEVRIDALDRDRTDLEEATGEDNSSEQPTMSLTALRADVRRRQWQSALGLTHVAALPRLLRARHWRELHRPA